jgi:uridine kinase
MIGILREEGINCIALPLDHFNLSPTDRKKIGTEWDIRHFKPKELEECLLAIFSGEKIVCKPTCDQLTGEIGSEVLDLEGVDLILFDGLYALCSDPTLHFFDYCASGIFLEAEESDIRSWKWEREQRKAIPRTPEQFAKHMEALLTEYRENIEYSKKNASFIIEKDGMHGYILKVRNICPPYEADNVDCMAAAL